MAHVEALSLPALFNRRASCPSKCLTPSSIHVVADYASHFSEKLLARVADAAGYEVLACGNALIDTEIMLVAQPHAVHRRVHPPAEADATLARRNLSWLEHTLDQAHAPIKGKRAFGVFGTSIAGLWIGSALAKQIQFFVDEDESRILHRCRRAPPWQPKLSQAIAARHADASRQYIPTAVVA